MKKPKTGRPSIFRFKHVRVTGLVSREGIRAFERRRRSLARITGRKPKDVSDGDTIEYLARGVGASKHYLQTDDTKG